MNTNTKNIYQTAVQTLITLGQSVQTLISETFKRKRQKTFEQNTLKNIAFYESKIIDVLKPYDNLMSQYFLHTCESGDVSNNEKYFKIQLFIDRFRSDLKRIDSKCFDDISQDLRQVSIIQDNHAQSSEDVEFIHEDTEDEKEESHEHEPGDEQEFDNRIDFTQNTITKRFTYNRLLHFTDYLNKIQGKKHCMLSETTLDTIRNDIKKYRLVGKVLTKKHMMDILQRHKFTTLYDFIPYILNVFNQTNTLDLGGETELYLITQFKILQDVFVIVCPKSRKSFINYKYTIFKLLELKPTPGNIAFCENMKPLLKSREKITKLDGIWKKMCEVLKWKYIPTE